MTSTSAGRAAPTENFFLLLDLDPEAPWDEGAFEAALARKQAEWTREQIHPVRQQAAQRRLRLIPDIKRAMADPAERAALAEAAKREREEGRRRIAEQFRAELELLSAKGDLLEGEVAQLLLKYGAALGEAEVRRSVTVPVRPAPAPAPAAPALDPAIAKQIRDKCAEAGVADLFAFVGLPGNPARAALYAEAQRIYRDSQTNAVKSPEVKLQAELAGFALKRFETDDDLLQYRATLAEDRYEVILRAVDTAGAATGIIHAQQVDLLLRQAVAAGLDRGETRRRIQERAAKKWAIEVPAAPAQAPRRCGRCDAVNPATATACARCAEPLRVACPRCARELAADAIACDGCTFPAGNRYWVAFLVEDARRLAEDGDLEGAGRRLAQAADAWPAPAAEPLAVRLRQAKEALERRRAEQDAALAELEELVRARRFYAAWRRLTTDADRLRAQAPRLAVARQTATAAIARAEQMLAQIARDGITGDEAARRYAAVLRLCEDCEEAQRLLAATPPAPPRELSARPVGRVVRLAWTASADADLRYVVMRKSRSQPHHSADGVALATVAGADYDDTAPEIGVPLYYAVFSDRLGVRSVRAARAAPVLLVAEVSGLVARVDDGRVTLTWTPPANARDVVVVRAEGRVPASPGAGVRLAVLDRRQATDDGLVNGRAHTYTVMCRFEDADGSLRSSAGVSVTATPQIPPRPIEALTITTTARASGPALRITWAPPSAGTVVVLKSARPPAPAPGESLPVAELGRHGAVLAGDWASATDAWEGLGACYYTAVVVLGEMALFGRAHRHVCIDDVSEAQAQNLGSVLRLRWRWPAGCEEVLVSHGERELPWPAAGQLDVSTVTVTRAEYDRHGYFDIRAPQQRDYCFTVQGVVLHGGERIVAPGSSPGARTRVRVASRVILRYAIERPRFGRRKLRLRLVADRAAELPALVLRRKQRTPPLRHDDGEPVLHLPPRRLDRETTLDLDEGAALPQGYARLFVEDPALTDRVTIQHPGLDKLALF